MAFEVNELQEATFDESDILQVLRDKPNVTDLLTEGLVTKTQLEEFIASPNSFVHDGAVFRQDVDSVKHALEYTHARTAIVHNGYENFYAGIFDTPQEQYFAFIAGRKGGLAYIELACEPIDPITGKVEIGSDIGILETFTEGGVEFVRGQSYPATGDNQVTISQNDIVLPTAKIGKAIEVTPTREFPINTILVLRAAALFGYRFVKWEGEYPSTESQHVVTLTHNLYAEATFETK